MGQQNEAETLITAWRALTGNDPSEGWRTIPVASGPICRVLAGRHFPGNEEAVLVGFHTIQVPTDANLPESNGFIVKKVDIELDSEPRLWIALLRHDAGNLDMFTMMASDVVRTLNTSNMETDERLLSLFLGRIRAWQSFMQNGSALVLSSEAEVGLHGELVVLELLIQSGLAAATALEAWCGPLDGIQDFRIGSGAIEVKTTLSSRGFSATVASLEQLDINLIQPLFIAGVRLRLDETGLNLSDRVAAIRRLLLHDPAVVVAFDSKLLHAGFSTTVSPRYPRRFIYVSTRIFPVSDNFPSLTRANVPNAIRKVRYEIDLELTNTSDVSLKIVLEALGANFYGTS